VAALRFGIQLNESDVVQQATHVEQLGFDYLTAGEHLLFHKPFGTAMLRLAGAATVTKSIRLMSAIALAPLYPPAILAWMAATLDQLSGGRFDLGVGVGGEFPKEFEAAGVAFSSRGRRTNEALEVINRWWAQGDIRQFEGEFTRLSGIGIRTRPVQERIPIWIAGRKEPAMRRAARYGDGWLPYMYSVEMLAQSIETISRMTIQLERRSEGINVGLCAFATVYQDSLKAKRIVGESISGGYHQDLRHVVDKYCIAGTPAECRSRLREYRDAGAQLVVLTLACPPSDFSAMVERVANEVLPEFRLAN
jgi:probable F420-dependent oxidoreductase